MARAATLPLACSAATLAGYRTAWRIILRAAWPDTPWEHLPLTRAVSPETVRAWIRQARARAELAPTQADANRILRSARSILNQARSLLAPHHCGHYADAGIALPDLEPFHGEIRRQQPRDTVKREWHPPDSAVISATLAAWRTAADRDPNLYLAMWLMLAAGLRRGEVAQARWSWIQPDHLRGAASVKNHAGEVCVTPLEPWWSEGKARARILRPHAAPEDHILTGSATERTNGVFRRISSLLRAVGWRSQKTGHALRALAGCWVAQQRGLHAAQRFLRHSSITVTERHYAWVLPLAPDNGGSATAAAGL